MSEHDVLMGEDFPHKVSAEYNSQQLAEQAIQLLLDNTELPRSQIRIIRPNDPNMGRKIEPEGKGISRTLVLYRYAPTTTLSLQKHAKQRIPATGL